MSEGKVLLNGVDREKMKGYRSYIGYVQYECILLATMTVRECIEFAAKLKLSGPLEDKMARVDKLITELRLTKCMDNQIENHHIGSISGGEKRRTCIGVELITDPDIIFLDDPTSGLDSNMAE